MPAKNVVKIFVEDGFYHIYNRGVNKRIIFKDVQDKKVFLGYLKEYLSPPQIREEIHKEKFTLKGSTFQGIPHQVKSYFEKVELLAYCLMSNHFHLLIKQCKQNEMTEFIRSLLTRYSMYFNKKYERVGKLFQGVYKAVLIEEEEYLLWLSRYIHRNPAKEYRKLENAYSSYAEYLGFRNTHWIKKDMILSYFSKNNPIGTNSYKHFVEKYSVEDKDAPFPDRLLIE